MTQQIAEGAAEVAHTNGLRSGIDVNRYPVKKAGQVGYLETSKGYPQRPVRKDVVDKNGRVLEVIGQRRGVVLG